MKSEAFHVLFMILHQNHQAQLSGNKTLMYMHVCNFIFLRHIAGIGFEPMTSGL